MGKSFFILQPNSFKMSDKVSAIIELAGVLKGHGDMVTCIVAGFPNVHAQDDEDAILVSGSRDKTLIIRKLDYRNNINNEENCGRPWKCLTGHNHFISDLTISNDDTFIISSSWDKTMRLWDLRHGVSVRQFTGQHSKEVLTTTFSTDNRQIFSGGADKTMMLWNTLAECKMTSSTPPHPQHDHRDWVSRIRYSQSTKTHYSYINALDISRNGLYIATGGKDQVVKMWEYH